ncbi:hypothetical protein BY458DRAFT_518658 [Sporodiniella umbellata]|nr:hypothetical protein BY458DRAFT_518658 [Sporodiniella umbellata]
MQISRNRAICMLFYVEFTKENLEKYKRKIESFGNIEICYNVKPNEPVLVPTKRIRESPHLYH